MNEHLPRTYYESLLQGKSYCVPLCQTNPQSGYLPPSFSDTQSLRRSPACIDLKKHYNVKPSGLYIGVYSAQHLISSHILTSTSFLACIPESELEGESS